MIVKGQGLCKLAAEAAHLPNDKVETVIDEVLLTEKSISILHYRIPGIPT